MYRPRSQSFCEPVNICNQQPFVYNPLQQKQFYSPNQPNQPNQANQSNMKRKTSVQLNYNRGVMSPQMLSHLNSQEFKLVTEVQQHRLEQINNLYQIPNSYKYQKMRNQKMKPSTTVEHNQSSPVIFSESVNISKLQFNKFNVNKNKKIQSNKQIKPYKQQQQQEIKSFKNFSKYTQQPTTPQNFSTDTNKQFFTQFKPDFLKVKNSLLKSQLKKKNSSIKPNKTVEKIEQKIKQLEREKKSDKLSISQLNKLLQQQTIRFVKQERKVKLLEQQLMQKSNQNAESVDNLQDVQLKKQVEKNKLLQQRLEEVIQENQQNQALYEKDKKEWEDNFRDIQKQANREADTLISINTFDLKEFVGQEEEDYGQKFVFENQLFQLQSQLGIHQRIAFTIQKENEHYLGEKKEHLEEIKKLKLEICELKKEKEKETDNGILYFTELQNLETNIQEEKLFNNRETQESEAEMKKMKRENKQYKEEFERIKGILQKRRQQNEVLIKSEKTRSQESQELSETNQKLAFSLWDQNEKNKELTGLNSKLQEQKKELENQLEQYAEKMTKINEQVIIEMDSVELVKESFQQKISELEEGKSKSNKQ